MPDDWAPDLVAGMRAAQRRMEEQYGVDGQRVLLTAAGFSLIIVEFSSLKRLETIDVGSEILSIGMSGHHIVVGCMRGVAGFTWSPMRDTASSLRPM